MVICSRFSLNSVMDFPSVVFYASLLVYFIGLVHQLSDVKIHLLIYFSSTLAFAALKDRVKLPV